MGRRQLSEEKKRRSRSIDEHLASPRLTSPYLTSPHLPTYLPKYLPTYLPNKKNLPPFPDRVPFSKN